MATNVNQESNKFPFERYSSWKNLQRVMAWMKRFINSTKPKTEKTMGCLSVDELQEAEVQSIKTVQMEEFANEIIKLKSAQELDKQSRIKELNPFLKDGVLRVGGRLKYA